MFLAFTNREPRISVWGALVLAALLTPFNVAAQSAVQCKPAGALMRVAELPEGSGLAASRRTPGRFWSHSDTNSVTFYRAAELLAGKWREVGRVPLTTLGEPQGEGVTFGSDSTMYLMSEGGGKKLPGAFARLTCTLNP